MTTIHGNTLHPEGSVYLIVSVFFFFFRLVRVGKEFSGQMSFDLVEVLKNSIRGFFGEFHRKRMERLRLFLDHESWEHVPVRSGFSLLDLHVRISIFS